MDIVDSIRANREIGAQLLEREYKPRLIAVASRFCSDKTEIEALVYRTMDEAVRHIETLTNPESFFGWMCGIMSNQYGKLSRRKINEQIVYPGTLPEVADDGAANVVKAIDEGLLREAIDDLPPKLRETVLLRYFMDMPLLQIARFLTIPVGTVNSRLHMARTVLAMRLGAKLRKPAVALVAAGLFLLASAAVVSGLHGMAEPTNQEIESAAVERRILDSSGEISDSVPVSPNGDGAWTFSGLSTSQPLNSSSKEKATMKQTTIGSLFRSAVRGISMIAMTAIAANATYGDDPYIEGDGTSGISTGYRMKGTSRLEVDFAMVDVSDTSTWNECRIFGTDNSTFEPTLQTCVYATYTAANGNKFFRVRAKTSASSSQPTKYKSGVDTGRHTVVFDLPNAKMVFMTGGVTNSYGYSDGGTDKTVDAGVSFAGEESSMPLSLFGRWGNAYATAFANMARVRIYGVKIYESDVLVHDFVPCLKDGVACFKDLKNGGFIIGENASAFTAGGDVQTFADDAYVSTAANADGGKLYFDTGYKATAKTAVALDCALTVNTNLAGSIWRLFQGSSPVFDFNLNGNNGLRYQAFNGYKNDFTTVFKEILYDDKDVRRTFYLDNRGQAAVVTSGHTNQLVTFSQTSTSANTVSIKLASNSGGNSDFAAIKIYGCKIWENGTLVRDFAPYVNNGTPGLRDNLTGAFIAASRGSGDSTSALACGGAIADDAYLQSSGTANISTGYKMNGASRLEVDFSLISTATQQRLFGTDSGENFKTYLYIDGQSHYSMVTPFGQIYTTHTADTIRHTGIIDVNHGWAGLVTGCTTNWSKTTATSYAGQEADNALPLFGRGGAYATERIYSVRIYESDALVHEFIPYGRGAVTGLYDTVTGDIISNGSSFSFGGVGQDYGQLKAYIKPGYAAELGHSETTTLVAYAPGATSYRWLMDGESLEGGSDGTLEVFWTRGGTAGPGGSKTHVYQAIAIYGDFYGVTRESEPEAAAIRCRPLGTAITLK